MDFSCTKGQMENLTLGILSTLERRLGVKDVCHHHKVPVEHHEILNWEQRNSCVMPVDLKNFYLSTDGFLLTWNFKINDSTLHLGRMEINPLAKLSRLTPTAKQNPAVPSISDIDGESDEEDHPGLPYPHFDQRSRCFELDPCNGYGKLCLVYTDTKAGLPARDTSIWLLDRSLQWHFVANTFAVYYRLMLTHLGLPEWQFACTDIGLSPQAKQWYNMLAPVRMELDLSHDSNSIFSTNEAVPSQLDIGRVFKGKVDKKKPAQGNIGNSANAKKKPSTTGVVKPSSQPVPRPTANPPATATLKSVK